MPALPPALKDFAATKGSLGLEAVARFWRISGYARLLFGRRPRGSFRVLAYHRTPDPRTFRRQMEWLAENRTVLPLSRLVSCLVAGSGLPENAVGISFDDGFEDNYTIASPILRDLSLPASFFITSDFVDLAGRGEDAYAAWAKKTYRYTKAAPPMRWEMVRALADAGHAIGCHTRSHPNLALVADADISDEVSQSVRRIGANVNTPIRHFAYPYGKSPMAPGRVREHLRAGGLFSAAFSTERGWNVTGDDLFWLRRDSMNPGFSPVLLEAFLSGCFDRRSA